MCGKVFASALEDDFAYYLPRFGAGCWNVGEGAMWLWLVACR